MPGYKLPHAIEERLSKSLAPYRNRYDAMTLARFLARFWSSPRKLGLAFPADRRRLAEIPALGLTEFRIRSALSLLEVVGFLDRSEILGSLYQRTVDGPHRKPILFRFSESYLPQFKAANCRSARLRQRESQPLSAVPSSALRQPLLPLSHKHTVSTGPLLMGYPVRKPVDEGDPLGTALSRLGRALGC
jgi:hypothetical protein